MSGERLREPAFGILCRALEHQMFEEMRESGLARRLVRGADLVPDHVGDDRRAMIGNDHDLEPVGEREMRNVGPSAAAPRMQGRPEPRRDNCSRGADARTARGRSGRKGRLNSATATQRGAEAAIAVALPDTVMVGHSECLGPFADRLLALLSPTSSLASWCRKAAGSGVR